MINRILTMILLCLASCLHSCPAQAQTDQTDNSSQADSSQVLVDEFTTRVRAISSGATSETRLASLVTLLDDLEVKYEIESFDAGRRKGKNLIVDLNPDSERKICVGAHFDQVRVGTGAIDNACSCAALMELLEQFRDQPLQNHGVEIVFFDLEEQGLLGSKAYVDDRKPDSLPDFFVNLDIFGYGDSFWLMSEDSESPLQKAFEQAAGDAGITVKSSGLKQYPPSDHVPFAEAEVPTLGVALIDEPEIEAVKSLLSGQHVDMPPILRIIHTPDDTTEKVRPNQSARAIPVVEAAIRWLDENTADDR